MSATAERLAALRARIRAAAERAGRDPASIALLGIAKRQDATRVAEAVEAGLCELGENYLQEALARREALAARLAGSAQAMPRNHFVGRLQRNKAAAVAERFDVLHTLDRVELGAALERHAAKAGRVLDVLVQVNTSGEAGKGGVAPDRAAALLDAARDWPHLRPVGLMTLPAAAEDPERVRPSFAALRELAEALRPAHPTLLELSMGMSADFEVAVEEGATILRIGSALFGPRE